MTTAVAVRPGVRIGPAGVPPRNRTLGWPILEWTADFLNLPDGPNAGAPWMFTTEQARFILNWYAIDERGRFAYRRGMLRRMKGWGKDPLGAVLCAVEFVGPCRFGGWDDAGMPIVVPHPAAWVQTAAVSLDQTRNTTTLFPGLFSDLAIEEYGIDLGKQIIYAHGGRCQIQAVTSSPTALEGGRTTFTLKNETHHWKKSNAGHAMADVIARNAAKSRDGSSRVLAISNAHNPGEDSDAEHDYNAYLAIAAGKSVATGFLYDSLEAPPDVELVPRGTGDEGAVTDEDRARARASLHDGLVACRGDSEWLDIDRLIEEIYDPVTPASTSRRFYLNQVVAAEDAWLTQQEWDACAVPEPVTVADGELITLGFDGSKSNDHSVLVGCRVSDGYLWMIRRWDPAEYATEEVPMAGVDAEVRAAFGRWDVAGFYSDYHPFESYVDTWEVDLAEQLCAKATSLHPIRWDMRGRQKESTEMAEAYHDAVAERKLVHANDPALNQYHYNARRRPNAYGVAFGKETTWSSEKVDGVASSELAWKARQDYLVLPENRQRQVTKEAGGFFA